MSSTAPPPAIQQVTSHQPHQLASRHWGWVCGRWAPTIEQSTAQQTRPHFYSIPAMTLDYLHNNAMSL